MATTPAPGTPCWAELGSPDPRVAATFYRALFGWEFAQGDPHTSHRTALLHGRPVAGLRPVSEPAMTGWTTFIGVTDTARSAAAAAAAGGSVLSSSDGDVHVTDPGGARFALRGTGARPAAPAGTREPGTFAWSELITDDVHASAAFYRELFAWEVGAPEAPLGRRAVHLADTRVALLLPRPPAMSPEIPPYWDAYFTVEDPAEAAVRASDAGGTVLMAPTDMGAGRIAVLLDPLGAVFTVLAHRK
ncbi:VOC family protein [Streptomyces sp. NPDC088354]|uniref:VOC family protein n=1 Tax=unclassified Streptomyces TaxID=2593676 RepID=UPI0029BA3859|nr:VOC family protein [Streptomyces sp. MI02-7b]MDX3071155.1 VOC family protein [Streptomyces sp. MI02-7b]